MENLGQNHKHIQTPMMQMDVNVQLLNSCLVAHAIHVAFRHLQQVQVVLQQQLALAQLEIHGHLQQRIRQPRQQMLAHVKVISSYQQPRAIYVDQ